MRDRGEQRRDQDDHLALVHVDAPAERELFVDLFRHAPDPYVVTDAAGVIRLANVAARRLLHVPLGRLVGRQLMAFVHDADRPGFDHVLQSVDEKPASRELVLTPREHPPVAVAVSVVRRDAPEGQDAELWWLLRDVTDVRRAQVALQEALAHSREEADELRDMDRWKDVFLAAAAHDLHVPLAVVGTTVRSLLSDHDLAAAAPLVQQIGSEVERLTRLLDDLLDLDRFTRGVMTAERVPTNMADLVARVVIDAHIDESDIEVDVPSVVADVDPGRTAQIVTNLVRNAWTHTPAGTPIRVAGRVVGEGVELVVEDEGPGVQAALREEIFRPFVTHRAHEDGPLGTGLGLSLVRLFAELHQGTAHVEDRPGGGMRVVVHLPARVSS